MTQVVRKTFTLTERDIEIIKTAMQKCGYVSVSEALRAIIKYFAENAPCLK
jgi:Arc/MetJ-type ribon-helix-helix transcriptional regulator